VYPQFVNQKNGNQKHAGGEDQRDQMSGLVAILEALHEFPRRRTLRRGHN